MFVKQITFWLAGNLQASNIYLLMKARHVAAVKMIWTCSFAAYALREAPKEGVAGALEPTILKALSPGIHKIPNPSGFLKVEIWSPWSPWSLEKDAIEP